MARVRRPDQQSFVHGVAIALKIRAEARRHDVPVIENRALARALYAREKVGASIPSEFFGPVAQILALGRST